MYFAGVEGGATHSNLVICDEGGNVVGHSKGPMTNHWTVGIDECANRIITMLHTAKKDAGIPLDKPLDAMGLTLSGCEQESSNAELAARVLEKDAACASKLYVASDTAGSLATAAPNGGMVLIAGTGSNGLLRTSSGKQFGCGGWGHLLGDEGGAYWIARRAIKTVFDDVDGLHPSPHSTERVWDLVMEYFRAESRADLLPHFYKTFDKSYLAGFTLKLSELASSGDPLATHLFSDAGSALAAHAASLATRAEERRLRVVCVGSVWKSWQLMKEGALRELRKRRVTTELELVRLKVSSAMGAAWLAAKQINYDLPQDDSAFCEIFYTYRPQEKLRDFTNGDQKHVNGSKRNVGDVRDGEGCGCNDWVTWS